MIESTTRDYGKINAWNFYDLPESKKIDRSDKVLGDVDCFLYLLFSNSSTEVEFLQITRRVGWVVLRLLGPVTEDQGRLSMVFRVSREGLHRRLPIKEERYAVVRRLHELGVTGEGFKGACRALQVSRLGLS
jgi:hypothetical protein